MIVIEFLVFVISSGLFFNERFRHRLWAVIAAGAIATGSSILFVYDLGANLAGHDKEPPVITRIIKQEVVKEAKTTKPASVGKPHTCAEQYPSDALNRHEEGVTSLAFRILTDGTVDAVKVLASSGSKRLDDAAVKCVARWHYRPAIKNGELAETDWKAAVTWKLPGSEPETAAQAPEEKPHAKPAAPKPEGHAWYDVMSWFGSDSEGRDK
jgi:TonB family protein